ncbi:hypothetical protein ABTG51_19970, partial [Acinetobacter baumannii]
QLNGTRMMASVNLIRALGGGWHDAESSVKSES